MTKKRAPPSDNGFDGRDGQGRFAKGNRFGKGCPYADRIHGFRFALLREITTDDFKVVIRKLIDKAKSGDLAAIHELLGRCCGDPARYLDRLGEIAAASRLGQTALTLLIDQLVANLPGGIAGIMRHQLREAGGLEDDGR